MLSKKIMFVLALTTFTFKTYCQTIFANYDGIDMAFSSWDKASWKKVANPYPSKFNPSANVAQFGHSGNNWWTGINCDVRLATPINFSKTPFIKMKVFSANPIDVVMKLENYIDSKISTILTCEVTPDQTNKWVELTFNFSGTTLTNLDRFTLFFDPEQFSSTSETKYYFDDLIGSDIPPAGQIELLPAAEATKIPVYSNCTIKSNLAMSNANGTELIDPSLSVQLKKGTSQGPNVPFTASISKDKRTIVIASSELLEPITTYWYGVIDSTLKYSQLGSMVSNVSATFTTGATAPSLITYTDFNGLDNAVVIEALGDPAGTMEYGHFDAKNDLNTTIKWGKGITNDGWERIHIEVKEPINVSGERVFSIRVKSPITTFVRLKVSDQKEIGGNFREADAFITKANEWQTLYFEFPAFDAAKYKHLLIYIDGGIAEPHTFFIDDIRGPNLIDANTLIKST